MHRPPPFLRNTEDRGVVGGFCFSNNTESKPFFQRLLHKSLVIRFEWELFVVDPLVVLEVESLLVGFATTQIGFRHTDHFQVFAPELQILCFELVWHIEVGLVLYFLFG